MMEGAAFIKKDGDNALALSMGAACIAFSVGANAAYFWSFPNGGSVSLEMLPLILYSYAFGVRRGAVVCVLSGLVEMSLDQYIASPMQAFVDYPLAQGCICIAGVRRWDRVLMTIVACAAKLFWHTLSGVLWFSEYTPLDMSPLSYSFFYNMSYMVPSWAVSHALAAIIATAFERSRERRASSSVNPSPGS